MEQVTLTVFGMSCNHCVKAIEGSVGAINGVHNVTVRLDDEKVEVNFDPSVTTLTSIKEAIEDQGYDVAV